MRRELPAGLSDSQRTALSAFFAGHLSAGQLSERLSQLAGGSEPTSPGSVIRERASGAAAVRRRGARLGFALRLCGVLGIALAGAVIGAAIGSGALTVQPSRAGAQTTNLVSRWIVPAVRHRRKHRHAKRVAVAVAPRAVSSGPTPVAAPAPDTTRSPTTSAAATSTATSTPTAPRQTTAAAPTAPTSTGRTPRTSSTGAASTTTSSVTTSGGAPSGGSGQGNTTPAAGIGPTH